MKVFVDDREPASMGLLFDSLGVEWVKRRMVTGDYVCGDVCVERKTIDDLCGSIVDGRLKRQIERMKKEFKFVYVLVSGKIVDRKSEVHENCILGKLVSMMVKDGVSDYDLYGIGSRPYVMSRSYPNTQSMWDDISNARSMDEVDPNDLCSGGKGR